MAKGTGRKGGSNKKKAQQVRGDGITPQQEAFCQEYVLNGRNGAQAYLKAYPISKKYQPQVRAVQASKLLANTKIQVRIETLDKQLAVKAQERFDISSDSVLQEIAAIAYARFDNYFEFGQREVPVYDRKTGEVVKIIDEFGNATVKTRTEKFATLKNSADLTVNQRKAIVQVGETISRTGEKVIEVKLGDKLGALDKLATILGLKSHTQKVELTGKGGAPIESVTHVIPDLDGVADPKAALRAFEDFRMGRAQGTRH